MDSAQVHRMLLDLPEVEEYDHGGCPAFRVRGKRFASMLDDEGVNLGLSEAGIRSAVAEWPQWCREEWVGSMLVAVHVSFRDMPASVLAELVDEAWSRRAPKRLARTIGLFDVAAESYDRLMGPYSARLATAFADFAGVHAGMRAIDVGCGPGALTSELVARVGADAVCAIEPSPSFAATARERNPGVEVVRANAEAIPFDDDAFDVAAAQLVVHFMADPVAGLREMARVATGAVAACVWDHAGGRTPIAPFWSAVREHDPDAHDESDLAGAREGHLAELMREAGLRDVEAAQLSVEVEQASFDDWWEPFTLGVGPAGAYLGKLSSPDAAGLRDRARGLVGDGPFTLDAVVWAARGVPSS